MRCVVIANIMENPNRLDYCQHMKIFSVKLLAMTGHFVRRARKRKSDQGSMAKQVRHCPDKPKSFHFHRE